MAAEAAPGIPVAGYDPVLPRIPLSYTLEIATDPAFGAGDIVFTHEEIPTSY